MKTLQAHYEIFSEWDLDKLDIDIIKVHKWYIKWDTLNIQREENGEWEQFEGDSEHFDYKRPDDIKIETPSVKGDVFPDGDQYLIENGDHYLLLNNGELGIWPKAS